MNLAFIPVRGGSKSIPGKNIKMLNGKPLIWWNLIELQASDLIDSIIVATDCSEIKKVVQSFEMKKVTIYDRSSHNAQDTSSTESVILEFFENSQVDDDDIFFLVQATSPFTKKVDFESALMKFKFENADSLLTCTKIKRFIWSEDGVPLNYDFKSRPRRQDFEGILVENGSFYISKVRSIKNSKNRLSGKIAIYIMDDERTFFELDDEQDWKITELLLNGTHK